MATSHLSIFEFTVQVEVVVPLSLRISVLGFNVHIGEVILHLTCLSEVQEEIPNELACKKVYIAGHDSQGRRIMYLAANKHYRAKRDLKECMRFLCYSLDKAILLADRSRNPMGYITGLFDLRGKCFKVFTSNLFSTELGPWMLGIYELGSSLNLQTYSIPQSGDRLLYMSQTWTIIQYLSQATVYYARHSSYSPQHWSDLLTLVKSI